MVAKMRIELFMTGVEVVEIKSATGKLAGNGNGIDYVGAALICGGEAEAKKAADSLSNDFDIVGYVEQTDSNIDIYVWERNSPSYDTDFNAEADKTYYTVYFQHSTKLSNEHDVRGH